MRLLSPALLRLYSSYCRSLAAVVSLITLLPLVVHTTPHSGGLSRPISVPPYLGPIFTVTLSLAIDGLIIAFIPLHLAHSPSSSSRELKYTLALGFVQSFAVALAAFTLVERVVMGSVKSTERAGFVRDVIMILWIGGVTLVGCRTYLLFFSYCMGFLYSLSRPDRISAPLRLCADPRSECGRTYRWLSYYSCSCGPFSFSQCCGPSSAPDRRVRSARAHTRGGRNPYVRYRCRA